MPRGLSVRGDPTVGPCDCPICGDRLRLLKDLGAFGEDDASDPGDRPAGRALRPAPARGFRPGDGLRRRSRGDGRTVGVGGGRGFTWSISTVPRPAGRSTSRPSNGSSSESRSPVSSAADCATRRPIATWLDAGLDRVVVGTQALRDPDWFGQMAEVLSGPAGPGAGRARRAGGHRGLARCLERSGTDPGQAVRLAAAGRHHLHRHRA